MIERKIWTLVDAYKSYNKKNPKLLTKAQYMKLMGEFFWELSNLIIRERYQFRIPRGMGILRIRKIRNKEDLNENRIDYGHFNKTGKIIRLLNPHTNNYYFRFSWQKSRYITNSKLYTFVPIRGNDFKIGARGLAKYIKDCANDPYTKDYDCPE